MITVAICSYNRAARLGRTLGHIRRLEVPLSLDWELLVVDNASTDHTEDVVRDFQSSVEVSVRYVRESHQGLSRARNTAVRSARGDIVAFTDDDVVPEPDWLTRLAEPFRTHECIGVGGRIRRDWEDQPPDWWLELEDELLAAIVGFDPGGAARPLERPPYGANMAFRSEAFRRYGGFRTDLGRKGTRLISGEDTEFGLRLLRANETIWYAPEATVHHPVSRERATKTYFRKWYYEWGRTTVRLDALPGNSPRILGIPRFLYRQLAEEIARMTMWGFTQRRLLHELRARQILGAMAEIRQQHREFDGAGTDGPDGPPDHEALADPASLEANG